MGSGSAAERTQEAEPDVRSWFDDSAWPILKVTLPPRPKDEGVAAYLKILATYRSRRERYALLVDVTHATYFSPRQRRMQADYMRDGLHISRVYLKAIAYVAESALKRGAITAIYWLVRPESPYEIFANRTDAEAWLRQKLDG